MSKEGKGVLAVISVIVLLLVGIIALAMWGLPKYRIYKQTLRGEATLREAQWDRKVKIEEAEAARQSAVLAAKGRREAVELDQQTKQMQAEYEAKMEVTRAEGVAKANSIIGESLKDNDEYLRYLWINNVGKDSDGERIYIPTEAGLPILEARSRN